MSAIELRDMPMFMGQPEDALVALEQAMTIHAAKAGEKLFSAQDDDDELILISSGSVKVTLPFSKKESYHLINSGPGEFIGGMVFLEGNGRTTEALTDTEVYTLSHKRFSLLARQHPTLALATGAEFVQTAR